MMTNTINNPELFTLEYQDRLEELNAQYVDILIAEDLFQRGMNEVRYSIKFSKIAREGLLGTIYDFASTIIRNVCRFVEKIINWFTTKIKSIINFRVKAKKRNDTLHDQFLSLWHGLNVQQKTTALETFRSMNIDFTPGYERFAMMCQRFTTITQFIDTVVDQYTTQEVAIFGAQTEVKLHPDWLKPELLTLLSETYNIRFNDGSFVYDSPFKLMDTATLNALGYTTMDTVSVIHKNYCEHVFRNLRVVTGLKERFVKYQQALVDKARELKRINTSSDKNDFAAASSNLVKSITLSTQLTGMLTSIEESLDTRRGWLIRKAIEACTKAVTNQTT